MSTYWPLYRSASNVIDENNKKFLKRNREEEEEKKRKIPYLSQFIKSFTFDRTGTYIHIYIYSTHKIENEDT
jgi:hypothetical protein